MGNIDISNAVREGYIDTISQIKRRTRWKRLLDKNYLMDITGREFSDGLSGFMRGYIERAHPIPFVPIRDGQHFVEGVIGVVLHREPPFQVQMFIAEPDCYIPPHVHPNVDSYEMSIRGMEFYHEGETYLTMGEAFLPREEDDAPYAHGGIIRVRPSEKHGATASSTGGVFLSFQHWLNGVPPTSVGNDWDGKTMGDSHTRQANVQEKTIQPRRCQARGETAKDVLL